MGRPGRYLALNRGMLLGFAASLAASAAASQLLGGADGRLNATYALAADYAAYYAVFGAMHYRDSGRSYRGGGPARRRLARALAAFGAAEAAYTSVRWVMHYQLLAAGHEPYAASAAAQGAAAAAYAAVLNLGARAARVLGDAR